jgi:hypothetical protein
VSVYKKKPDSNIGKIISLVASELEELQGVFTKIEQWRSVDVARGTTLDLIGENVVQARGKTTDEVFRILIKSKIARNFSTGDINNIIDVLAIALDAEPSEIGIHEHYEDDTPQYASLSLDAIPISRLNEVGMTPDQFVQLVKKVVAAGVRVNQVELSGTFEFSSLPNAVEIDDTKGFSDLDGLTGGYFGAVYDSGKVEKLPI